MKTSLLLVSLGLLFNAAVAFKYQGVNQAGAEFGSNIPGVYMVDYTFPTTSSIDYFVNNGMNTFRVPFLWERLQPTLNGAFDSAYLGRLKNTVQYITQTKGVYCLIDVHNYALYNNVQIGAGVDYSAFQNLWQQLAGQFKSNPKVIFGLMNEPHDMPYQNVFTAMQAGVNGVRASGATNLILVPGNDWTGAHSWMASAPYMGAISDPLNNFMFEMHQYFDENYSGNGACDPNFDPAAIFDPATSWLRAAGNTGFLGEFGIESSTQCLAVLTKTMAYLQANSDVWQGYTWWAAGPWWGSYKYSLEKGAGDAQFAVIKNYMSTSTPTAPISTTPSAPATTGVATPAAPSTTGRVKTPVTAPSAPTAPATVPSTNNNNNVPSTSANCTSGNMKCLSANSYSMCNWGNWGKGQQCGSGTVCSPSGNYVYCVAQTASSPSTPTTPTTPSTPKPTPVSTTASVAANMPLTTGANSAPDSPSSSGSCTLGQLRCVSSNQYQTCGNGANGFQWSVSQSCQSGLSCHSFGNQIYCY